MKTRREFLKYSSAAAVGFSPIPSYLIDCLTRRTADLGPTAALAATPTIPLGMCHPEGPVSTPNQRYNLLLVGQNFSSQVEFLEAILFFKKSLPSPLDHIDSHGASRFAFSCYFDSASDLNLGLSPDVQAPAVLVAPNNIWDKLDSFLAQRFISVGETGEERLAATEVWPRAPRSGRSGALIAVIQKGGQSGEFYDLSGGYSTYPLVATVASGDFWPMVIVRAIGQTLGGLCDEYELPGQDAAPIDLALDPGIPNLLFFAEGIRASLTADSSARKDFINNAGEQWKYDKNEPTFIAHPTNTTNDIHRAIGGINLIEGGGTYRSNVLRADYDCLLRRVPAAVRAQNQLSDTLRIQDRVNFCEVCSRVLYFALHQQPEFDFRQVYGHQTPLSSQYLEFDAVHWSIPVNVSAIPLAPTTLICQSLEAGSPLTWACDVEVNQDDGLVIHNLQLRNRPDPFTGSDEVIKTIRFIDLGVKTDSVHKLLIKEAISNRDNPPKLEIYRGGGRALLGIKLTLVWPNIDGYGVEVTMSLVLRDQANDIDPGGAANACKIFPQLAMSYFKAQSSSPRPRMTELHGSIEMTPNNTVKTNDILKSLFPGIQDNTITGMLVTDSNSSDYDNDHKIEIHYPPVSKPPSVPPILPPAYILLPSHGRRLAGVGGRGTFARILQLYGGFKPLVHWSWIFDYALKTGPYHTSTFVFPPGDPTKQGPAGGPPNDGGTLRTLPYQWPPEGVMVDGTKPMMLIEKLPRQGSYDNVHFVPDLGHDAHGRHTMTAPFCADKCLHLHTRWGTVATSVASNPYGFLGWGNGNFNRGAHRIRGAPLVPPNQRVDITITQSTPSSAVLTYSVSVRNPKLGTSQVFLEQAVSFAFAYGGLANWEVKGLALNVGAETTDNSTDVLPRTTFHRIYSAIRWFSPSDGVRSEKDALGEYTNVQQIPGDEAIDPKIEGW